MTAAGKFLVDGRTVHYAIEVSVSVAGTASGYLVVTLPHSSIDGRYFTCGGVEIGHDGDGVAGVILPGSNLLQLRKSSDGSYPAGTDGDVIVVSGSYEIA